MGSAHSAAAPQQQWNVGGDIRSDATGLRYHSRRFPYEKFLADGNMEEEDAIEDLYSTEDMVLSRYIVVCATLTFSSVSTHGLLIGRLLSLKK